MERAKICQYVIANGFNGATNIHFRATEGSTRFHRTRERISHLIWHHHNYKSTPKLSDLFQGTHSQTFNKVKKRLRPSPLLKLKACFTRQVDVVSPQAVAAKVTVLYGAVHLNLRSVLSRLDRGRRAKMLYREKLTQLGGGYLLAEPTSCFSCKCFAKFCKEM